MWIRLDADVRVTVGRLGRYYLPEGMYVYIGSARRGLAARLARHQRRRKPLRWHVDYLLTRRAATIECIETRAWREGAECRWVRQTLRDGGRVVVPGFGAGDCRARCGAHLLAMPDVRGAG